VVFQYLKPIQKWFLKKPGSFRDIIYIPGGIPCHCGNRCTSCPGRSGKHKYKVPVYAGSKLVAKAEVKKSKDNKFIVWVKLRRKTLKFSEGNYFGVP